MKTFIAPGLIQEFTAPAGGVVSGTPYLIGSLLVVATETVAATLPFRGLVRGVVDVTKVESEAWTEGAKIYWDNGNENFTTSASGNTLVGVAPQPINAVVVALSTDADPSDLLISGLTLQVLDFAQLDTDNAVVTVTVNGVATVLTEGTDWTAITSDDVTATNLAAAIDAIDGVSATATTDTVTVVPGTGVVAETPTLGRVRLDGAAR